MATSPDIDSPASILHPPPVFIAGPTAVGKSAVALTLAERLGGEIISVDSMQVYRGLDIGTAKPTIAEQARVPHHLIDVAEVTEPFDAARFAALAKVAVGEIQSRGHVPIFCGGTGLYFKACLDGLGQAPPADVKLRVQLEATPLTELLRELEQCDPATFATIDRQNPRRVIRAVEVIRLTGKPFSVQRAEWNPSSTLHSPSVQFYCLSRPTSDLHARINLRVDGMFAAGLVEETCRLLERGLQENKTAMQAIGYRQVVEHLRGERSLADTTELIKIKTRQFAKRQMTWFRKYVPASWLELLPDDSATSIASRILTTLVG